MKRIVLTGGGTAGHVALHLAMIPKLKEAGYDISYIGSYTGIEKELITQLGVPYYGISSGKLRRYFDLKNFTDPFRILKGISQSKKLLRKIKPDIVFSKGGFVSVPVVRAAKSANIPVIIHESDITPGLSNRLSFKIAKKICYNFPETAKYLPSDKAVYTGSPIREELFKGDAQKAKNFCGFTDDKPAILIMGGSTGSVIINNTIRGLLPELLKSYNVIHLCGKDKTDENYKNTPGYRQFEYISDELSDLFAYADIIISRAGANSICEFLALNKPNILIPLSANASRGDQILNAASFEAQGFSVCIQEENLTNLTLLEAIENIENNKEDFIFKMNSSSSIDSGKKLLELIKEVQK